VLAVLCGRRLTKHGVASQPRWRHHQIQQIALNIRAPFNTDTAVTGYIYRFPRISCVTFLPGWSLSNIKSAEKYIGVKQTISTCGPTAPVGPGDPGTPCKRTAFNICHLSIGTAHRRASLSLRPLLSFTSAKRARAGRLLATALHRKKTNAFATQKQLKT
jgi:hypothetical protein